MVNITVLHRHIALSYSVPNKIMGTQYGPGGGDVAKSRRDLPHQGCVMSLKRSTLFARLRAREQWLIKVIARFVGIGLLGLAGRRRKKYSSAMCATLCSTSSHPFHQVDYPNLRTCPAPALLSPCIVRLGVFTRSASTASCKVQTSGDHRGINNSMPPNRALSNLTLQQHDS